MKQALMSQYESAKGEKANGKGWYLKYPGVHVNFSIFSCLFRVSTFFVFVSCLDLGFSCFYRYTRNTKHEVFVFRVPISSAKHDIITDYSAVDASFKVAWTVFLIRNTCTAKS